jgi:hypothetical protein
VAELSGGRQLHRNGTDGRSSLLLELRVDQIPHLILNIEIIRLFKPKKVASMCLYARSLTDTL